MGVVCRFVGSKRSETKRLHHVSSLSLRNVISNCPIMKRNEARRAMDEKEKSAIFALLSVSAKKPTGEMERMMGVEPTTVAWEATVLPLNYIRM